MISRLRFDNKVSSIELYGIDQSGPILYIRFDGYAFSHLY